MITCDPLRCAAQMGDALPTEAQLTADESRETTIHVQTRILSLELVARQPLSVTDVLRTAIQLYCRRMEQCV